MTFQNLERLLEMLSYHKVQELLKLVQKIGLVNISTGLSTNLTTILLFVETFPYTKPTFVVSLKYWRIHFTACQCSLPRLVMHSLTTLTAREISGWVQTIAYIMLPTTLEWGTWDVLLFFLKLCWQSCWKFLKCVTNGVLTNVDQCILKSSSTFSI